MGNTMKMERSKIFRTNVHDDDDGFVDADKAARLLMMWDITRDAWAFTGGVLRRAFPGLRPGPREDCCLALYDLPKTNISYLKSFMESYS